MRILYSIKVLCGGDDDMMMIMMMMMMMMMTMNFRDDDGHDNSDVAGQCTCIYMIINHIYLHVHIETASKLVIHHTQELEICAEVNESVII
jgi:hypothetical protein